MPKQKLHGGGTGVAEKPDDKIIKLSEDEKLSAIRELFKDDLLGFAKFILQEHMTLQPAEFHKEIYGLITKGHKKVAIAAPRGTAKSTIITLAFILWNALTGKKKFIIIACDTYPQAKLFLEAIKRECETNEFLQSIYGQQKTDKWTEADIELSCGVRIMAKGAEMKFRGLKYGAHRPDLVVIDDLENEEMTESNERRNKLRRWFSGTLMPVIGQDGQFVYIGTILHDDSLLQRILSEQYFTDWITKKYAIIENGKSIWPDMYSTEQIEEMKAEATRNGQLDIFMAEYMNDPITDENREFKRAYFKYYNKLPEKLRVTITVDLAISKRTHADYTVIYVQGTDKENNRYCLEYIRGRFDPYEGSEALFQAVEKWKPVIVGIEKVAYQEAFSYIVKDEMRKRNKFFITKEIITRRDKEQKIRGLIPMYRAGVMYHRPEHIELEEELLRFPKGIHDDIIDCQAMQQELTLAADEEYVPEIQYTKEGTPIFS